MYPGMGEAAFWLKPRSRPCTNAPLGILCEATQANLSLTYPLPPPHPNAMTRCGGSPALNADLIFWGNLMTWARSRGSGHPLLTLCSENRQIYGN